MSLDPSILERIQSRIQVNKNTGCWSALGVTEAEEKQILSAA